MYLHTYLHCVAVNAPHVQDSCALVVSPLRHAVLLTNNGHVLVHSGANSEGIATLVKMAGESLRQLDGHLYVIGSQSFGVMG